VRFGFHISISGGFSKVLNRAVERGCEAIQLFSRNPRGWKYSPLDRNEVTAFKADMKTGAIDPVVVHMPYLPNLASAKKDLYARSVDSLCTELRRTEALEASFLIMHVGSSLETPEERALENVANGITVAFKRVKNNVVLLLENTAGMGTEIGCNFNQMKRIFDLVEENERLGVVLDTAHAFEAGYDLRTKTGLENTLKELDTTVGLDRLRLLHLNDSKTDLGSRVDRHWHIGEGKIGLAGFRNIVNHPSLKNLPGIMETPRMDTKEDLKNMEAIRNLVR
jgi:deoxyribonuclease-4